MHPYAIKLLVSLLYDAAQRAQLIVSTQSSLLLDELSPDQIIVVNHQDGETVLEHFDPKQLDLNFNMMGNDLIRRMKEDANPETRFTTMIDFYGLPTEFPGWKKAQMKNLSNKKIEVLEVALQEDINPKFRVNFIHYNII